jgi:hypothetical protein
MVFERFQTFLAGAWVTVGICMLVLPWFGINLDGKAEYEWALIGGFISMVHFWNDV